MGDPKKSWEFPITDYYFAYAQTAIAGSRNNYFLTSMSSHASNKGGNLMCAKVQTLLKNKKGYAPQINTDAATDEKKANMTQEFQSKCSNSLIRLAIFPQTFNALQ